MRIEVESKRLYYILDVKGKYSVIQGDSGNGKTCLCRLIQQRMLGDRTIRVDSELPLVTIAPFSDGADLQNIHDSIVAIDEDYRVLREPNLASLLRDSNNYFIIIYRKNLDFLPLCVENLYDMKTDGRKHWLEQKYKHHEFKPDITIHTIKGLEVF